MTRHEVGVRKHTHLLTKIADKARCDGVGGPFLVVDIAVLPDVEAKPLIAFGELFESPLGPVYRIQPFLQQAETRSDLGDMGFEVRIDSDDWLGVKRFIARRRARGCGRHWGRAEKRGGGSSPSLEKSELMTLARPPPL